MFISFNTCYPLKKRGECVRLGTVINRQTYIQYNREHSELHRQRVRSEKIRVEIYTLFKEIFADPRDKVLHIPIIFCGTLQHGGTESVSTENSSLSKHRHLFHLTIKNRFPDI